MDLWCDKTITAGAVGSQREWGVWEKD